MLTNLPLVPHIYVDKLIRNCFRQWLFACSAPSHYLNQCWLVVNRTLSTKLQWNSNQNDNILFHENACERVVCKNRPFWSGLHMLTCFRFGRDYSSPSQAGFHLCVAHLSFTVEAATYILAGVIFKLVLLILHYKLSIMHIGTETK